jgi:hypothetical protein
VTGDTRLEYAGVAAVGGAVGAVVWMVMRPRGAVSIGGDAAGVVVVVGATVDDVVVDTDVDVGVVGLLDDEHAPATITAPSSATHRFGPRRTNS